MDTLMLLTYTNHRQTYLAMVAQVDLSMEVDDDEDSQATEPLDFEFEEQEPMAATLDSVDDISTEEVSDASSDDDVPAYAANLLWHVSSSF